MGTAIKHPVPDRVKPSFLFLTSGHSDAQSGASECPDVKNYKWRLNPIWSGTGCFIAVSMWQQWAPKGLTTSVSATTEMETWPPTSSVFTARRSALRDYAMVSRPSVCQSLCDVGMRCTMIIYTVFRKKHPLTFSFISPWVMCVFKQKLQRIYLRNGRLWQCRN